MVNFFDERFIVIQDDSRLHRTELNLRQHDRTILISIIAHVFILSSQGPIFGKMHHIDQRLVGRVIENIRIVLERQMYLEAFRFVKVSHRWMVLWVSLR